MLQVHFSFVDFIPNSLFDACGKPWCLVDVWRIRMEDVMMFSWLKKVASATECFCGRKPCCIFSFFLLLLFNFYPWWLASIHVLILQWSCMFSQWLLVKILTFGEHIRMTNWKGFHGRNVAGKEHFFHVVCMKLAWNDFQKLHSYPQVPFYSTKAQLHFNLLQLGPKLIAIWVIIWPFIIFWDLWSS